MASISRPKTRRDGTQVWTVRYYPRVGVHQKNKTSLTTTTPSTLRTRSIGHSARVRRPPDPSRRTDEVMTLGDFYVAYFVRRFSVKKANAT